MSNLDVSENYRNIELRYYQNIELRYYRNIEVQRIEISDINISYQVRNE